MTSWKFSAVLFGALLVTIPASADVVRWGGLYAGPAHGPTGPAGPTWTGYPGKNYISLKGMSDLRASDGFVFGAFAVKQKAVQSFFRTEPLPLMPPRFPLLTPGPIRGETKTTIP